MTKGAPTCSADSQVLKMLNDAFEKLPRERYHACNRPGTLPNPIKVDIRSHERNASFFRFIVMKAAEAGIEAFLMRGNRVQTKIDGLDGLDGIGAPSLVDFNAVDRARMSGIALAAAGQVEVGQWFYLAGSPDTLYYLGGKETVFPFDELMNSTRLTITKVHQVGTGRTMEIKKTMSQVLSDMMSEQRRFEEAYQSGRAI